MTFSSRNTAAAEPLWRTDFDPILNQVYYINTEDGSTSFDLPCEVHSMPKRTSSGNIFAKISSRLSLIRSKSANVCPVANLEKSSRSASWGSSAEAPSFSDVSDNASSEESGAVSPLSPVDSNNYKAEKLSSGVSDYFSAKSRSYQASNYLPTNEVMHERSFSIEDYDDVCSVATEESIQSFRGELPRSEVFYCPESGVLVDELSLRHAEYYSDSEREQEKYELRQQMLRELY